MNFGGIVYKKMIINFLLFICGRSGTECRRAFRRSASCALHKKTGFRQAQPPFFYAFGAATIPNASALNIIYFTLSSLLVSL